MHLYNAGSEIIKEDESQFMFVFFNGMSFNSKFVIPLK